MKRTMEIRRNRLDFNVAGTCFQYRYNQNSRKLQLFRRCVDKGLWMHAQCRRDIRSNAGSVTQALHSRPKNRLFSRKKRNGHIIVCTRLDIFSEVFVASLALDCLSSIKVTLLVSCQTIHLGSTTAFYKFFKRTVTKVGIRHETMAVKLFGRLTPFSSPSPSAGPSTMSLPCSDMCNSSAPSLVGTCKVVREAETGCPAQADLQALRYLFSGPPRL